MRLLEDIVCILLLVLLPDWILEVSGLYESMYQIIKEEG